MKFIKTNKRKVLFMFFVGVFLGGIVYFGSSVSATTTVDVVSGDGACFNGETGNFVRVGNFSDCKDDEKWEVVKTIGNKNAYCVQWSLDIKNDKYVEDTSWKKNTKNAIMAGYLINLVEGKYKDNKAKAYIMTGATLNSFFRSKIGGTYKTTSWGYLSKNDTINNYYKSTVEYGDAIKLTKNLPKISISTDSDTLSISNDVSENWFVSSKITIKGLQATYGGNSDKVTYKIVATASNGKEVRVCTNLKGTGCKTEPIELSGVSGSKDYYIFVKRSDFDANDTITLKVTGSNKSEYPSSILYKDPTNSAMQKLLVVDKYSISRTVSKEDIFSIPSTTNHRIVARKVDENGESLSGATLEIYKDDINNENNRLATNNGSGSSVTYTSPVVVEEDADFFNHDYYLVEQNSPDGYVLNSINKFYVKGSINGKSDITCYKTTDTGEANQVNNEYCNFENYDYKCQNTSNNEIRDLDDNKNCEFSVAKDPDTEDDTKNGQNGDEEIETATYKKVCYNKDKKQVADDEYCDNKDSYVKISSSDGNLTVKHVNKRNLVKISKKAVTGKNEVVGASLKVCTEEEYNVKKAECTPAKTIDDIEMSWISGEIAHDIYGVPKGYYYIVEVTPPSGYIRATIATKFRIDNDGTVTFTDGSKITNDDFVNKNGAIVIDNELTSISISKQDMATSKELPGATISICQTYVDENNNRQILLNKLNGECIEAVLADGTVATWVSTDKPKKIEGLGFGTYYLVEKIAPDNYTTAESIQFTLKEDGSLVDKDGKSLTDNKLVMKDAPIEEVKTGNLSIYIVVGIFVVVVALGIGSYYYLKNNKAVINTTVKKIRKRKIYKK